MRRDSVARLSGDGPDARFCASVRVNSARSLRVHERAKTLNHESLSAVRPASTFGVRGVLERLPTRASGENSLLMLAVSFVVRVFIEMLAPMHAMVGMLEDLVDKNAEAMFLRLI